MLNFPLSPTDHTREANIIKQIAISNGYECNMVARIIFKHRNKNTFKDTTKLGTEPQEKKYVSVDYSHLIQNHLQKDLKKYDLHIAFKTTNGTNETYVIFKYLCQSKVGKSSVTKLVVWTVLIFILDGPNICQSL